MKGQDLLFFLGFWKTCDKVWESKAIRPTTKQPKQMKTTPFRYPLIPQDIPEGIKCAQRVQQYGGQEPRFLYACPDSCWKEHCTAWERRRAELRGLGICPSCALEPFPFSHVIFSGRQGNYRLVELATTHAI